MNTNSNTYFRYLRLGLSLRPVRGYCDDLEDFEYAWAVHCENVQYVLNDFGEFEKDNDATSMMNAIDNLDCIANSDRHETVLAVQKYIESNLSKPVWCMVSTEEQLGITFGTEDGYVAQLIMDFSTEEKFISYRDKIYQALLLRSGISEDQVPEIAPMKDFFLIPSDEKYDAMFYKMNVPGVIVEHFDDDNTEWLDFGDDEDD